MTNDYKELLLKYLTGNIEEGTPSTTPFYENFEYTRGVAEDWVSLGTRTIKCKDGNGVLNGKTLCIGANGGRELILVDEDRNVLATYTAFDTGTPFNFIVSINVDEEGRFYAIDRNSDTGECRFLLLNNLSEPVKTSNGLQYKCVLRNSWFLQGYDDYIGYSSFNILTKNPGNATYYFALLYQNGGGWKLVPSTLQINVGEANTWTKLQDINLPSLDMLDYYVVFNSNNEPSVMYYCLEPYTSNSIANRNLTKIYAFNNNVPESTIIAGDLNGLFDNITSTYEFSAKCKIISSEKCWLIMYGKVPDSSNYKQLVRVYIITPGSIQMLLSQYGDVSLSSTVSNYGFMTCNAEYIDNTLYLLYSFKAANSNDAKFKLWFTLLNEKNKVDYTLNCNRLIPGEYTTIQPIILSSAYDFKKIIYQYEDSDEIETDIISLVYNDVYYNGGSYEGEKSLIPKQGLVYDGDNKLVFARTLYNTKVYNNRTISILNIPYNMLNTGTISKSSINGWLNANLCEENIAIEKNRYEDLYINYFITLTMENRNTTNYIENYQGAARLNRCNSQLNEDYKNDKATKIRINFDDGTTLIKSTEAIITNNVATYKNTVYVPEEKNIETIDYISEDEETLYNTMSNLNLTKGKYYLITQDVYVE